MTTPHKHAEVLHALADGKEIQWKNTVTGSETWHDFERFDVNPFMGVGAEREWRIKPEKKTGWLLIGRSQNDTCVYLCPQDMSAKTKLLYVAQIQIEYTEGEGL